MDKKTINNESMDYYKVGQYVMREDVIDTVNSMMQLYIDVYSSPIGIALCGTKNKVIQIIRNTRDTFIKIFYECQKDIEWLLSSEELKQTFFNGDNIKTQQQLVEELGRYFYWATFEHVCFKKDYNTLLKDIEKAIREKKSQIEDIKKQNMQQQINKPSQILDNNLFPNTNVLKRNALKPIKQHRQNMQPQINKQSQILDNNLFPNTNVLKRNDLKPIKQHRQNMQQQINKPSQILNNNFFAPNTNGCKKNALKAIQPSEQKIKRNRLRPTINTNQINPLNYNRFNYNFQ